MATERVEIDIIAKGKPAEKAIKNVERRTEELNQTTKKTGTDIDGVLTKMRAGWLVVGVAITKALMSGREFERASIGLSKEMKRFALETAKLSDVTATQIAGFLKSAETAGLNEVQMKRLAEQAIALGYAFPHEDAETLHDNLVMLNATGEAQGFIVDILEQKLSQMGIAFEDIDLKALSVSDKLKLVNEVVEESSKAMENSGYASLNKSLSEIDNGFTSLGDTIMEFLDMIGIFTAFNKIVQTLNVIIQDGIVGFLRLKNAIWETEENTKALKDAQEELNHRYDILFNRNVNETFEAINHETKDTANSTEDLANKTAKLTEEGERLQKQMSDNSKEFKKFSVTGQDVVKNLSQGFANLVMGVKTNFQDMAKGIIARLIQVRTEAFLTQQIASSAGGGGLLGSIGKLFFHSGTAEVKHTGGYIGHLPSYHSGMRSDERLAKLQSGEAVINRAGASRNRSAIEAMNAGYSVGGGGSQTTANINFNVQAIDSASFNNYLVNNRDTIEGIINSSLVKNGSVRRTIRQTL